jgi:hypothetical protein
LPERRFFRTDSVHHSFFMESGSAMTPQSPVTRSARLLRGAAAATAALIATGAWAHEGHGMPSLHWHATDVWGFVAVGALLAFAVWVGRR